MLDARLEEANQRIESARTRVDSAKRRAQSIADDAKEAIANARARVKAAARQGASWKVLELFLRNTFAALGATSYLWVSAIGLFYTAAFYYSFESIKIFDYFSTADFLLSAFANVAVPILAGIVTIVSLCFSWRRFFRVSFDLAYSTGRGEEARVRPWKNVFDFLTLPVLVTIVIPIFAGLYYGSIALDEEARNVRVTISQNTGPGVSRLPNSDPVKMLGTTSAYHIFHECAPYPAASTNTQHNEGSCEDGRTLIVPSSNIVALEFNPRPASAAIPDGLSSAIIELKTAIDELEIIAIFSTGTTAQPVDMTQVMQAIKLLELRLGDKYSDISDSISKLRKQIGVSVDQTVFSELNALNRITGQIKDVIVRIERAINEIPPPPPCPTIGGCATPEALHELKVAIEFLHEKIESMKDFRPEDLCMSTMERLGIVGSFASGKHASDENTSEALEASINSVACKLEQRPPQHVFLVGRVDAERLSVDSVATYGTDIGLARRRANWVREKLSDNTDNGKLKNVLERAIHITDGPFHTSEPRTEDRRVDIWACWAKARTTEWKGCSEQHILLDE